MTSSERSKEVSISPVKEVAMGRIKVMGIRGREAEEELLSNEVQAIGLQHAMQCFK